jgi:hypothetical protein
MDSGTPYSNKIVHVILGSTYKSCGRLPHAKIDYSAHNVPINYRDRAHVTLSHPSVPSNQFCIVGFANVITNVSGASQSVPAL